MKLERSTTSFQCTAHSPPYANGCKHTRKHYTTALFMLLSLDIIKHLTHKKKHIHTHNTQQWARKAARACATHFSDAYRTDRRPSFECGRFVQAHESSAPNNARRAMQLERESFEVRFRWIHALARSLARSRDRERGCRSGFVQAFCNGNRARGACVGERELRSEKEKKRNEPRNQPKRFPQASWWGAAGYIRTGWLWRWIKYWGNTNDLDEWTNNIKIALNLL